MDLGLKGKTVIVTGGASNIGRAIAITLAAEGANVVIADIDDKQMEKTVEVIKSSGGKAIGVKTDITERGQVNAAVQKALDEFGSIYGLVNNVGWDDLKLFIETTPALWDKIVNINFKGMLNCTHTVLPHMIKQAGGAIVSIGSDAGRVGEFKEPVYSGCKGAIIALSKAVAREVGKYGIRLNVVCPGYTIPTSPEETGELGGFGKGFRTFPQDLLDKIAKNYPLGRMCKPQDIASAVAFLLSDAASFITGQTLSVSGGYTMI